MTNTIITQEAYLPLNFKVVFIAMFEENELTMIATQWEPNEPSYKQAKKLLKKYRKARAIFHQELANITNQTVACFDVENEQIQEFTPTVRN